MLSNSLTQLIFNLKQLSKKQKDCKQKLFGGIKPQKISEEGEQSSLFFSKGTQASHNRRSIHATIHTSHHNATFAPYEPT